MASVYGNNMREPATFSYTSLVDQLKNLCVNCGGTIRAITLSLHRLDSTVFSCDLWTSNKGIDVQVRIPFLKLLYIKGKCVSFIMDNQP